MDFQNLDMKLEIELAYNAFKKGGVKELGKLLDISSKEIDKVSHDFYGKPLIQLDFLEWEFVVSQIIFRVNNVAIPINERQAKSLASATGRMILSQLYNELVLGKMTLAQLKQTVPHAIYLYLLQSGTQNLLDGNVRDINQDHLKDLPSKKLALEEYEKTRKKVSEKVDGTFEKASTLLDEKNEIKDMSSLEIKKQHEIKPLDDEEVSLYGQKGFVTNSEAIKDVYDNVKEKKCFSSKHDDLLTMVRDIKKTDDPLRDLM